MYKSTFRNDIAGLRGIAIILVVLNHLTSRNLQHGYIGVDIFFVISGYLIIGGMIRTYEESITAHKEKASYSVVAFYIRRILRLAPAATVVIAVTLIFSIAFFNSVRATLVLKDALWSVLLLANYHFLQTGVDYFSRQTIPSPFQHFWSLSIEEQFYIVFPVLFVFLLSLHGFRIGNLVIGWRSRINLALIVGFVLSFVYAFFLFRESSLSYYFSTYTRAWQLLLGGLVYVIENRFNFSQDRKSKILRLVALISTFTWAIYGGGKSEISFSVIIAASLFSALSILSFSSLQFPARFLIVNKPFIFMGSISYSLYLWHWPVRIFAINFIDNLLIVDFMFVFISIGVAFLSRKYVELPFLKIKLKPSFKLSESRYFQSFPRISIWEIKVKVWIALLAIFSMPGIALVNSSNPPSSTTLLPLSDFSSEIPNEFTPVPFSTESPTGIYPDPSSVYEKTLNEWSIEITNGLNIKTVPPTLDPPFSQILDEKGSQWNKCLFTYKNANCVFGTKNASRKVVVFGDSFAVSLIPAIQEAFSKAGVEIIGLTLHECSVSNITPWLLGKPFKECQVNRNWAFERIRSINPELLIMAENATFPITKSESRASESDRNVLWSRGIEDTFKILTGIDSKIVYVGQWPIRDRSITDCVDSNLNISSTCIGKAENGALLRSLAQNSASKFEINFVDSSKWLCNTYLCPAIISNSPVTFDNSHLASTFSRKLGPILKVYFESIGVVDLN